MILKLATVGFALVSLFVSYLIFVAWGSWSWADFFCAGSYWECHRKAVPDVVIFGVVPFLVWATSLWLLVRAWKRR